MACACVNKCVDCGTAPDSNSRQETAIALAVNPLAEVNDFIQRHGDDQTPPEWLQQVDTEAPETSFQNVTITIQAPTSREAYDKLCTVLASIDAEWTTDTFFVDGGEDRCTSELWSDAEAVTHSPAD
jgi:hypothetical protein